MRATWADSSHCFGHGIHLVGERFCLLRQLLHLLGVRFFLLLNLLGERFCLLLFNSLNTFICSANASSSAFACSLGLYVLRRDLRLFTLLFTSDSRRGAGCGWVWGMPDRTAASRRPSRVRSAQSESIDLTMYPHLSRGHRGAAARA